MTGKLAGGDAVQPVMANQAAARWLALLYILTLPSAGPVPAQRIEALGPQVRKYVRVATPKVILEHVQIFDGTGAAPLADRNIHIENGKIAAVKAGADQPPSDGTTVLDLRGHSVMPGIVGMHNHLFYLAFPNLAADGSFESPTLFHQMSFSAPRLYLANGVTTMRTTGSVDAYTDLRLQQVIERGLIPGPHLDVTGPYLEGAVEGSFLQMHPTRAAPAAATTRSNT